MVPKASQEQDAVESMGDSTRFIEMDKSLTSHAGFVKALRVLHHHLRPRPHGVLVIKRSGVRTQLGFQGKLQHMEQGSRGRTL